METYDSYLSKVKFEEIQLAELTVEKLYSLKKQQGVLVGAEGKEKTAVMHSFEGKIKVIELEIREVHDEFIAINRLGMTVWRGTAEEVIGIVNDMYEYEYDERFES